jgi:hypothetical protein
MLLRSCILLILILSGFISAQAQLFVASGERIKVTSTDELVLQENLVNNGTIDNITFSGTASQDISGTGTITNLKMNKASGTATISSGMQTLTGILTPTAGTLASGGRLTLKSDNSGSASIGVGSSSGGYITGDVVTQRYLTKVTGSGRYGRAWRLVSIPVTGSGAGYQLKDYFMGGRSGANLTDPTNRGNEPANLGTVVIGHNQPDASAATTAGYDWIGVPGQVSSLRSYVANATTGSFASSQVPSLTTNYSSADQGYMVFARGDRQQDYTTATIASSTTLQATGVLKQGTQNITIPGSATAGYVLVGNPYVSLIDMDLLLTENSAVIENTFYIWDSRIDGVNKQGAYRTISKSSGSWAVSGSPGTTNGQYIESHTAFFVKPTAAGGTLNIKETHKVTGTPGIAPHGTAAGTSG